MMSPVCGIMVQVHNRRARPTLRLLQEDLTDGWDDPEPRRNLGKGKFDLLHPLTGLRHPIVAKPANASLMTPMPTTTWDRSLAAAAYRCWRLRSSSGAGEYGKTRIKALTGSSSPGDMYSNIAEPGAWADRVQELEELAKEQQLAEEVPGSHAHYTHKKQLTEATVQGKAVRALCGTFFVPTQDHEKLPACPTCRERWDQLDSTRV